jgi:hypothetical protein
MTNPIQHTNLTPEQLDKLLSSRFVRESGLINTASERKDKYCYFFYTKDLAPIINNYKDGKGRHIWTMFSTIKEASREEAYVSFSFLQKNIGFDKKTLERWLNVCIKEGFISIHPSGKYHIIAPEKAVELIIQRTPDLPETINFLSKEEEKFESSENKHFENFESYLRSKIYWLAGIGRKKFLYASSRRNIATLVGYFICDRSALSQQAIELLKDDLSIKGRKVKITTAQRVKVRQSLAPQQATMSTRAMARRLGYKSAKNSGRLGSKRQQDMVVMGLIFKSRNYSVVGRADELLYSIGKDEILSARTFVSNGIVYAREVNTVILKRYIGYQNRVSYKCRSTMYNTLTRIERIKEQRNGNLFPSYLCNVRA